MKRIVHNLKKRRAGHILISGALINDDEGVGSITFGIPSFVMRIDNPSNDGVITVGLPKFGFFAKDLPNFNGTISTTLPKLTFRLGGNAATTIPSVSTDDETALVISTSDDYLNDDVPSVSWEGCCDQSDSVLPGSILGVGIIKARITAIFGFDAGRDQSLLPLETDGSNIGSSDFYAGNWLYRETGGRDNGGYIISTLNTEANQGQYNALNRPVPTGGNGHTGDLSPQSGGMLVAFNLFGQTLPRKMSVIAVLAPGFGSFIQTHVVIDINVDRTVSAVVYESTPRVLGTSTILVPADDWFALEPQYFISPVGNDVGGFLICKLYTLEDPVGTLIINAVGVKTRNNSFAAIISGEAYGTQARRGAGEGVAGIGVDDVHFYNNQGTVKRVLGDLRIGASLAAGQGLHSESSISYIDSFAIEFGAAAHTHVFGVNERWGNVNKRLRDVTRATPLHTPLAWAAYDLGASGTWNQSPFTGNWLPIGAGEPNYIGGPTYNRFTGEQRDSYKIEPLRTGITIFEVVARAPITLTGVYTVSWSNGFSGAGSLSSNNAYADPTISHTFRPFLITNGTLEYGKISIANNTTTWKPQLGYGNYERDVWDSLNVTVTPALAAATEVGLQGVIDVGAVNNEVHAQQVGMEYSYRKQRFIEVEQPPLAPIVNFTISNFGSGAFQVTDTTAFWDGVLLSRSWNFGDGDIGESVTQIVHQYLESGNYNISLTVTSTNGLGGSKVQAISIPHVAPTASFSKSGVGLGPISFTDLSIGTLSTIVSRLWNFGDGVTSTLQNPSHTYITPGTYSVSLTVTDNHGLSNTASINVTVPIVVLTDCNLSIFSTNNVPYVQGDDFNGGNAPIPPAINLSTFLGYYHGVSLYRGAYGTSYSSDTTGLEFDIDTTVLFQGHPTFRMSFGTNPLRAGRTLTVGAGWATDLTNDSYPAAETYVQQTSQWFMIAMKAEAGVMSQVVPIAANNYFSGLEIFTFSGWSIYIGIYNRNGHLYLDVQTKNSVGAYITTSRDLGLETSLIGRSSGFGQVIGLYESDNVAHTARLRFWLGTACALTGVPPIIDETFTAYPEGGAGGSGFGFNQGLTIDTLSWFNWIFTPSGNNKNLWVGMWETMPLSVSANPYGVSLT